MLTPHSDAFFIKAYPAETTEAFCDGHVSAFAFFGGVPLSILYDNTTIAVAKICGDGKRERTGIFSELQSHYLFDDKFGRPGKGNDKGNVEGVIGYGRRNFLVPAPRFNSFDELNVQLNAQLEEQCLRRQGDKDQGKPQHSADELAAFYADKVNSDEYLPPNMISSAMCGLMLERGLVTTARLRMRGVR